MTEKRAELEALSKAKLALEAERSQSDRRGRELNENVLNVERSVSKLEQKRATSAMEEQQILDKLWENYELSHSAAQEQRIELESVAKASRRIGELKRAISGLGAVNVGAIEEFERVNTRYTYLTTQRDDVEKAKGELVGVIDSITSEMTVIFKEQFALIRESFQETFLELFGGGKATLELEDENDVLSCGIEIKVQPPGKALKTITLLSGGEKAFVAIALYFAILKVPIRRRSASWMRSRRRSTSRTWCAWPITCAASRAKRSLSSSRTAAARWRQRTFFTASRCRSAA